MNGTVYAPTSPEVVARAWVGCMGCYNMGRRNGRWMVPDDAEQVGGKCGRCGSDEFWCYDVEGVPVVREMSLTEFVRVGRLAEAVAGHPHSDAVRLWMGYDFSSNVEQWDYDPDEIIARFDESFDGEWDSYSDYAYEWVDNNLGKLDEMFQFLVVDWDQTGRDLAYLTLVDGGSLFIFREV